MPPLGVDFGKLGGYLLGRNEQTQMVFFDRGLAGKCVRCPRRTLPCNSFADGSKQATFAAATGTVSIHCWLKRRGALSAHLQRVRWAARCLWCEPEEQEMRRGFRRWVLVPRNDATGPAIEIPTPPQFIWHYAAAAEDTATGAVTIDACVFDDFAPGAFDLRRPATITRSTLCR